MTSIKLEAIQLGRKAAERWLLDDISLTVNAGDRIALVGPSGSGKSLLLRPLALLDPFDTGEIRWQGNTPHGKTIPEFRRQVIYLHQRPALVEGSVEDNLRQPFSLHVHAGRPFDRLRVVDLLTMLDRDESFLTKQQGDLSGGEAQLTALLRAIQLSPHVLLLDEPTAALDAAATELVERLVSQWLDEQPASRAFVWVTHNQEQARRVSSSVLNIRDGKLT